jgi:acyl-CoA synthetase (AMP-forming)/AMP-acid ligase II/alkylation response protein AidB-like acyl-CoA dehydrogenase
MSEPTLVNLLLDRAHRHPDRLAYAFLEDGAAETQQWTYGELHARAAAVAARLQDRFAPGARILLLYPAGIEVLAGFFGCLYAGMIAIPAPPPEASRLKRTGPRLRAIAADAAASALLTTTKIRDLVASADPPVFEPGTIDWLCTDGLDDGSAGGWRRPAVRGTDLAYLQYTSGSTSSPKGVMIAHRSVRHHLESLQRHCGYEPDSVTVTWMPYFHDYGLVEGLLEPLHNATPCYVMSPFAFIKRPASWLRALSQFRGTHSQAPNFAYDLCVRRVSADQRDDLDLRDWRNAANAAEPINPRVLRDFHEAFQSCGFRWEAFCPAYGLAEATLQVCSSPPGRGPLLLDFDAGRLESSRAVESPSGDGATRTIVGCGKLLESTRVAIVNPETLARCGPGEVGEIWVSDPAVAQGYWGREEETEAIFRAYTAETREGPFLRTGDLGFLCRDELFIGGRLKDLIIIRGTNHYPQDIEWTVQASHPALRPENGAAFSVLFDGQERLVIAQEVEREFVPALNVAEVVEAIRQNVGEEHEIDVFAVLLLTRGSLPKTASAKIQRQACRVFYLEGGPEIIGRWVAPVRAVDLLPSWVRPVDERVRQDTTAVSAAPSNGRVPGPGVTEGSARGARKADELIGWLRSYASERINSRLMDKRRCIPPYLILDLGNRGLLGLQVPRSHEGLELGYGDALRVLEQIAAIDLNLAAVVFLHNTNGIRPIQYHARPELRDELLPRLATGRELAAFALSEPGAGSYVGGIGSLAHPREGGWRLTGIKRWNQASWAGVVSVFVRLVRPDGRLGGMTGFAVRQGTPGLRIGPEALSTGLRGSVQNSIFLQDVGVTERELLGEPGKGMEVAEDALAAGRVCTAAVSLGAMKRCAQLMIRYAGRRTVATGRLIENPVTVLRLGELSAQIAAMEALLRKIAGALDAGEALVPEVAMSAKILMSEAAVAAAGELMQLLGGRGYMENNLAPQILRDTRVLTVGEGPNETLAWHVGRSVLQTASVARFIGQTLGAPEVAVRLEADVAELVGRCEAAGAAFADRSARRAWASFLAGRLVGEALLLAAVRHEIPGQSTERAARIREWAGLRYEESLRLASQAAIEKCRHLDQKEIGELLAACVTSIGDIEQDLPGEEEAIDPYLRLQPERVPGTRHDRLPGAPAVPTDAPADPPARPTSGGPALASLSPQAKRALLEEAVRRRMTEAASTTDTEK